MSSRRNGLEQMGYQRTLLRHDIQGQVTIVDCSRTLVVGHLVNIHEQGLMLMGPGLVQVDHLYQLELQLPQQINGRTRIAVGADCLWSRPTADVEQHWAGFQIIDLSDEARADILCLIERMAS